ncbi:MAG TPA: thioredoxin family protein [Candidatus Hydrogenedentes bacterium]|nr:thioredoxin family protein [Candidatus Hydrogenedentota bacterium]HRK34765.1 thioredoxin family protein [Candidatus Hydrogenedentota bacterium]
MRIVVALLVAASGLSARAEIPWSDDYAASFAKAKEEQRPIILDFTAEWCVWCKRLDEEVYADASIAEALKDFVCIRIDVDKQPNVALAYSVQSMPRTVVINVHDEIVGDLNGYAPLGPFLEFIASTRENLAKKTNGTPAPKVTPVKSGVPEVTAKPPSEMTNGELVELLGNADPEVRRHAAIALDSKPNRVEVLVAALGSDYLGSRIAAFEILKQASAEVLPFDPWAAKPERDAQLSAWQAWAAKQNDKR